MISVLILTLNEEANIAACLDSVAWADDVLVLDSGSEDRTVAMAKARGARVVHRPFDSFAGQRNYGLQEGGLQNDWVLHLDADERVTPALYKELVSVTGSPQYDAYRVPSKLIFRGQWLKHAGMYPTYQIRFGHRNALSFVQVGHGQRGQLPARRIGTLNEPLLHYAFSKGIADWFARHNRYSTDEAQHALQQQEGAIDWKGLVRGMPSASGAPKGPLVQIPASPVTAVFVHVRRKAGLPRWRPGFDYCLMMALYEYMIGLKVTHAKYALEHNR